MISRPLSIVAVLVIVCVYSSVSASGNECTYIYTAQPPPILECNPFGQSLLQLACSLYLGDGITPGVLDIAWFLMPLTEPELIQLTNVQFSAKPRQNYTSRLVVREPPPGVYFCLPTNENENFTLLSSKQATIIDMDLLDLEPCIIGDFMNFSMPECAQSEIIALNPVINATAQVIMVGSATIGIQPSPTPTNVSGGGGNTAPRLWVYILIGGIGLSTMVAVISVGTVIAFCYREAKRRKGERPRVFRKSTNTRYIANPGHTPHNANNEPQDAVSLQSATREPLINIPPPPSNPPPILVQADSEPYTPPPVTEQPQEYLEPSTEPQQQQPHHQAGAGVTQVNYYSKLKFQRNNRGNSEMSTTSTHIYVDPSDEAAYITGSEIQRGQRKRKETGEEEEEGNEEEEEDYIQCHQDECGYLYIKGGNSVTVLGAKDSQAVHYKHQPRGNNNSAVNSVELELSSTIGIEGGRFTAPSSRNKKTYVNILSNSSTTKSLINTQRKAESNTHDTSFSVRSKPGNSNNTITVRVEAQLQNEIDTSVSQDADIDLDDSAEVVVAQLNPYHRLRQNVSKESREERLLTDSQPYKNWRRK